MNHGGNELSKWERVRSVSIPPDFSITIDSSADGGKYAECLLSDRVRSLTARLK